jgi:hypothetical protein
MLKKTVGAAILLVSTAAHAQPAGPQALGVWDSQGRLVGNLVGQSQVELVIVGKSIALSIEPTGIPVGTSFYYTTPDCSGQPYLDATSLPINGYVLGDIERNAIVYFPGPITSIVQNSAGGENSLGQLGCSPISQVSRTVAPAYANRFPTPFTPPFCVSATKVRCQ